MFTYKFAITFFTEIFTIISEIRLSPVHEHLHYFGSVMVKEKRLFGVEDCNGCHIFG